MPDAPSLLLLCMYAVKDEILDGADVILHVYELPSDLFDALLPCLPPLALLRLHENLPLISCDDDEHADFFTTKRKRKRSENFETAWKALYELRWPESIVDDDLISDWKQLYWEAHLQNCLDAATEILLVPLFDGCLGQAVIPDTVVNPIGYGGYESYATREYSKLSFHCQQYGLYARCLRLRSVLCVAEISHLLRKCKLQSLELQWIKSTEQVEGLCKLLKQNSETLASVEFIHCKLSTASLNAICDSLHMNALQAHEINHFSIKRSSFLEISSSPFPEGLSSFLSAARSLSSLDLSDNHLQWNYAKVVFNALLNGSSSIGSLDLSENNITGWLSHFKWKSLGSSQLSLGRGKPFQSLRVLNLSNNFLSTEDADCLKHAMVYMPNLEVLDLSDNPIGDDGIRSLVPYFVGISERDVPFADLNVENCELSCTGVNQLLSVLSTLKKPLNSLLIGDNDLGSKVGVSLGKFLRTGVRTLNFRGIGLGSLGFLEAKKVIIEELKVARINMSNNRGGSEATNFLSNLILRAPQLIVVDAGYNCMPMESMLTLCSSLKVAKGKLEVLDLTGNNSFHGPENASLLAEVQVKGRPNIILSSSSPSDVLYDNDP